MAKVVVPGLADDIAVPAVVGVAAHQPVLVLQFGVIAVHPLGARVQGLGLGDPVQQLGRVGANNVVFMISFNDEAEGARPFEVDIKLDWRSADKELIGAQDRSDLLPEGAALAEIDRVLIVLQTHAELGLAETRTLAISLETFTAIVVEINGSGVVELFQSDFKDSLRSPTGKSQGEYHRDHY